MCRQDGRCPECNLELAAAWRMRNDPYALSAWLTESQQRHAAARNMRLAEMRVGVHAPGDDTPPLAAMAAFRDALYGMTLTSLEPSSSRVHLEPPDPYATALENLRKETR